MAYQCNNCGPGMGSNYSPHNYEGNSGGYETLGPEESGGVGYEDAAKYDNNPADEYQTAEKPKEGEEEKKDKGPSIEDSIKEEEKETHEDEGSFKSASQQISKEFMRENNDRILENKKKNSTIDEAINKAIKDQKDIVRVS